MAIAKSDLIDQIAGETGLAKKDVKAVIDGMLGHVTDSLRGGKRVQLTGFGTFEVRERRARSGIKSGTQVKIEIPGAKLPTFRPGAELERNVKRPYRTVKEPAVKSKLDRKRLKEVLRQLPPR